MHVRDNRGSFVNEKGKGLINEVGSNVNFKIGVGVPVTHTDSV